MSHTSLVPGNSGTGVTAPYPGQVLYSIQTTSQNNTSGSWVAISGVTITLTSGLWLVSGSGYFRSNNATFSNPQIGFGIGNTAAQINSEYGTGLVLRARTSFEFSAASSTSQHAHATPSFYVRSDGTNLYFADGATFVSASQVLVLACFGGTFTSGPTVASGHISAVRIA